MENIEAATLPRQATALLHFRKGQWLGDGLILFNGPSRANCDYIRGIIALMFRLATC